MKVLYNRASCDANGRPYDQERAVIWWDEGKGGVWTGYDTPDVPNAADGPTTANGKRPFRMSGEGVGRLLSGFYQDPLPPDSALPRDSSSTPADGPLPEFYEPVESPPQRIFYTRRYNTTLCEISACRRKTAHRDNKGLSYVLCTSSLTEHWCAGGRLPVTSLG